MEITETPNPKLKLLPPDPDRAVKMIDGELSKARQRVSALERDYKAGKRELDRHITKLEKARDQLRKSRKRTRVRAGAGLDPHTQAGQRNIDKAMNFFRRNPVATQAQMASEAGIVSGASTWTIKALLSDGLIEPTGKMVGISREYRLKKGKGRVTRLEPGQAS